MLYLSWYLLQQNLAKLSLHIILKNVIITIHRLSPGPCNHRAWVIMSTIYTIDFTVVELWLICICTIYLRITPVPLLFVYNINRRRGTRKHTVCLIRVLITSWGKLKYVHCVLPRLTPHRRPSCPASTSTHTAPTRWCCRRPSLSSARLNLTSESENCWCLVFTNTRWGGGDFGLLARSRCSLLHAFVMSACHQCIFLKSYANVWLCVICVLSQNRLLQVDGSRNRWDLHM